MRYQSLNTLAPYLVLPVLMAAALPFMDAGTWATLGIAGIAMGMMLFLMASGLTVIFGLMDVLNFAHGAFITVGAYLAVTVLPRLSGLAGPDSWPLNLAALLIAVLAGAVAAGALGWVFERVFVRGVYGSHLRQILITVGALIIAEQLVIVVWGPQPLALPKPTAFRGSVVLGGGVAAEKFRLIAVALGLVVYIAMHLVLNRTRVGLLVRAGVENREMVEALGYRIRRLFIGVFIAGTALAGIGGVMWGLYQELLVPHIGSDMMILVFIVLIIGGLGSVGGCFVAAMLVGLTANYIGFLAPKLALGSNILLMAAILMWRPRGLFPLAKS